jgi:hypothetical protein
LGLSYLWTGSINGIKLQIWATWIFYAVLVDLGDAVAMAHQKGKATDPVKYFADLQNRDLGIIKQKRKPNIKLIVAPFPELQRGTDQFFSNNYPKAS